MIRIAFLLLLLACIAPALAQAKYDRLIVFGDSLSDIGNNTWIVENKTKTIGAPITNENTDNQRPLWVNALLELGQQKNIFANATIVPARTANRTSNDSIDFAYASAKTSQGYFNDDGYKLNHCKNPGTKISANNYCIPGVLQQIKEYVQRYPDHHKNTLYVIWAGGNDLFDDIDMIIKHKPFLSSVKSLSLHPAKNLARAAGLLIQAGVPAQHILIIGLPNLLYTPAGRAVAANSEFKHWLVNEISTKYNKDLQYHIEQVHGAIFINVAELMADAFNNPAHYGLTNVADSCVDNPEALAKHCQGYMFYNEKHPTTTTGKAIAEFILPKIPN